MTTGYRNGSKIYRRLIIIYFYSLETGGQLKKGIPVKTSKALWIRTIYLTRISSIILPPPSTVN